MSLNFFQHQWKAFWRSKNTGKSVAIRVVMGIFIAYLLLNLLALSFFLDKIIQEVFPDRSVVAVFTSYFLYYFLTDLLMRFQLQELPTLTIKPYLHLPIRRNKIVNHLAYTSLWSAFNFSPFLFAVPFMVKTVLPDHGTGAFIALLLCITGITLFNHFFSMWLKRKVNLNAWYSLGFFAALGILALLDYYLHVISFSKLSEQVFLSAMSQPWLSALPLALAVMMYMINHRFLKSNLYLDELQSNQQAKKTLSEIPFLDRFGRSGDLVATELKLILRNKRPKSAFMMSFIFLFYGLIFYRNPAFSANYGIFIFCGMFMTGIFIINYGQFMFSWQSSHFDGILVSRININDFFRSKILLFTIVSTANFLLTIPYVFMGWEILIVHFVMFIWNIGINTLVVLYFANRNYKKIDLSKSASFNWEGVGATQWLLSLPLFITPYIIYLPFSFAGYKQAGLLAMVVVAIIFIITREFWINKLVASFHQNRYKIAEGFRND